MDKLDRSKCPPEYTAGGSVPSWTDDALADAWTHRDAIVSDTVARVAAAMRKKALGLFMATSACDFEDFADALVRGEVEL